MTITNNCSSSDWNIKLEIIIGKRWDLCFLIDLASKAESRKDVIERCEVSHGEVSHNKPENFIEVLVMPVHAKFTAFMHDQNAVELFRKCDEEPCVPDGNGDAPWIEHESEWDNACSLNTNGFNSKSLEVQCVQNTTDERVYFG